MPSNNITRSDVADEDSTSHNASGNPAGSGYIGQAFKPATVSMGTTKTAQSISRPGGSRENGEGAVTEVKTNSERATQEGLLRASDAEIPRRPVETSIWDWDTPLDVDGDSPSYLYEPQGELLLAQTQQRPGRSDFVIPQTISSPGLNWPFHTPAGLTTTDGFAVPRRPTSSVQATAGLKRKSTSDQLFPSTRQPDPKRASHTMSESGEELQSPTEPRPSMHHTTRAQGEPSGRTRSGTNTPANRPGPAGSDPRTSEAGGGPRRTLEDPSIPMILPARKVFPIQIGDRLFRLSGASISSDAPSYFSQFFEEQLRQHEGAESVRTLYIDRDPATFEDISLHLQGYHIEPRDGPHFVKLFADAQFYSLPRLTAQLFSSTIYIRIGDEEFQIPRDLFSNPGDSPNYFSLGFSSFFTAPNDVFPGLSQRSLLRPPSILPPSVPNRSAKTFADLMHILKGYPVEIRSDEHRTELLRDARYFHLKGLEQRIIPHQISYNLVRKKKEILIRLEDIRQSGISFVADNVNVSAPVSPSSSTVSTPSTGPGWIHYQRPFVDSEAYSLIIEISGEETTFLSIGPALPNSPARVGRALFYRQTLSRVTSLFSVIASKMNLPITQPLGLMMMERGAGVASLPVSPGNTGLSEEHVKVRIGPDADVSVDGERWAPGDETDGDDEESMDVDRGDIPGRTRGKQGRNEEDEGEDWVVQKSQWRLRVQPLTGGSAQNGRMEVIMGAVKIEAFSTERGRNSARGFLT